MKLQKYVFVALLILFTGSNAWAQCLSLPHTTNEQFNSASKIVEGKVVSQHTFVGEDGNIYTSNSIDIYRVFKGDVYFSIDVITEGGVFGDVMQVVTPSTQIQVGNYGLVVLTQDAERSTSAIASAFYPIDEKSGNVYGLKNISHREALYENIARFTGTKNVALRRIPLQTANESASENNRATLEITDVFPLEVTAGTQTVVHITGQGFGAEQGTGHVAFHNADDGGQSFVNLPAGPHYLSWTDTEIQLYVPSATLYNTTVAGTGSIQVVAANGAATESSQQLTVHYAKSEIIYAEQLNNTMLVGMQSGGYTFNMNEQLHQITNGNSMVEEAFLKWACNTGVNFKLANEVVNLTDWPHDNINLIGLSYPGQLPSYLLGKTITTFSGCGSANGLQWNLIEVDILLNSDIDWWTEAGPPTNNKYDLETTILHEIGHAHLLQHNNNLSSPMYFQLTEGSMRRDLHQPSIEGGNYISTQSVETTAICGEEAHELFHFSTCNLSEINSIEEQLTAEILAYPNPFSHQITVSGDWNLDNQFFIFDATGRVVLHGVLNTNTQTIATSQLSTGVYALEVRDSEKSQVERLIKN